METTIQEAITGSERVPYTDERLAALAQFYHALNSREIDLMEQNWDASDAAVMDNPLGGIRRGWKEIRSVYARLFSAPVRYHFEFHDYTLQHFGDVFIAIGRERGRLMTSRGTELKLAIRTTRVFRKVNDRWKQVHHHGSIDDPEMLSRYQQAVLASAA